MSRFAIFPNSMPTKITLYTAEGIVDKYEACPESKDTSHVGQ
jgi:hypothetical protein